MENNSKSQKFAVIALAVIIAASAIFLAFQMLVKGENLCAVVSVDGQKVAVVVLDEKRSRSEIDLEKHFGVKVVLETEGDRIRFKTSSCPDKICINNGWLSRDMDIAVCMPNKTSVVVMPQSQAKSN